MPTAREENRHLHISLDDGTEFTVPPLPGRYGKEATALLISVSMGAGEIDEILPNTERLVKLALGQPLAGWRRRQREFEDLRATQQEQISQAAIVWNCQGGSIDAVNDLFDEAGGYPKALGRVMESCGLGREYELLQTWLNGVSKAPSSETASTADTSTPTGTANTSAS